MREILFRGKRKDNGEWIEGFFAQSGEKTYIIVDNDIMVGYVTMKEVFPKTIGQYTGLTDKNGTKIFEGDIIRYADEDEYNMYLESLECPKEYDGVDFSKMWAVDEVVYAIEIGYPAFDLNESDFDYNGLSALNESYQYFYEVIGNIHDNPELLKEV